MENTISSFIKHLHRAVQVLFLMFLIVKMIML